MASPALRAATAKQAFGIPAIARAASCVADSVKPVAITSRLEKP